MTWLIRLTSDFKFVTLSRNTNDTLDDIRFQSVHSKPSTSDWNSKQDYDDAVWTTSRENLPSGFATS